MRQGIDTRCDRVSNTYMTTCSIVTGPTGERCGAPAIFTFTSRSGDVLGECVDHHIPSSVPAAKPAVAHPKTDSRSPFLLVAGGRIVGYARSDGPAVIARARKLGAKIVPN